MTLTRRGVFLGLSAVPILASAVRSQESRTLTFRTSGLLPRSEYIEDTGWSGYEVDITRALAEATTPPLKIECTKSYNWKRALGAIRHGHLDLMAGVSFRKERTGYMDYIGTTDLEDVYLITKRDTKIAPLATLDDLTQFPDKIQINFAAAWNPEFDKRLKEDPDYRDSFVNITGSAFDAREEFLTNTAKRILFNRSVGAILAYYSARQLVELTKEQNGHEPLKITRIEAFGTSPTFLVASRQLDPKIRDDLKTAYSKIRANGSFEDIWKKWYQSRNIPGLVDPTTL